MRVRDYTAELEHINQHFGGKGTIKFKEVQEYTGRGYRWCVAHLDIPHNGCTPIQLAKALAALR